MLAYLFMVAAKRPGHADVVDSAGRHSAHCRNRCAWVAKDRIPAVGIGPLALSVRRRPYICCLLPRNLGRVGPPKHAGYRSSFGDRHL